MATKDEPTTDRPLATFDDFDTDELLDELGITDDDEAGDAGQQTEDTTPADEAPAEGSEDAPASSESGVEGEAAAGPADDESASSAEATTASDEDHPQEGTAGARPFTFNVDRQEVAIDGAFIVPTPNEEGVVEEMVVMPLSTFQRQMLPKYVGDRQSFTRALRAKDLELEEIRSERSAKEAQVETILNNLNGLLSDRDKLAAFLDNFEAEAGDLRHQAEAARLQAENEALKRPKLTPEQRLQREEEEAEEVNQGLRSWVTTLSNPAELRKLGIAEEVAAEFTGVKLDLAGIYEMLTTPEMRAAILQVADEDDPAMGLVKGKPAVRLGVVLNLMRREAALARRLGSETREVVTRVRENTRAVNGGPRKQHPATGRAGGSDTPVKPQGKVPMTKQEWLDSLDED